MSKRWYIICWCSSILQWCCIIWSPNPSPHPPNPPPKKKIMGLDYVFCLLISFHISVLYSARRFRVQIDIIPESNAQKTYCIFRIKPQTDAYKDIDKSIIIMKITVIMGSWQFGSLDCLHPVTWCHQLVPMKARLLISQVYYKDDQVYVEDSLSINS